MGVHSTRGGVSWMDDGDTTPGHVGMLSQSGMNASEVVSQGIRRKIHFSDVASFGNASDLNEADFLEFLAQDPETHVTLAYLEGIRDGRRFLADGASDEAGAEAVGGAEGRVDGGGFAGGVFAYGFAGGFGADLGGGAEAGGVHAGQQH